MCECVGHGGGLRGLRRGEREREREDEEHSEGYWGCRAHRSDVRERGGGFGGIEAGGRGDHIVFYGSLVG